jgi:hypothetical protein
MKFEFPLDFPRIKIVYSTSLKNRGTVRSVLEIILDMK